MQEGFVFFILISMALLITLLPIRKERALSTILVPILLTMVGSAYWHWGGWRNWQAYKQEQANQSKVKAIVKTIKTPQELIDKFKNNLEENPDRAQGWYLLGRLYVSQNQWEQASNAFAKAQELEPNDLKTKINYATSLWEVNHRQLNRDIRARFNRILKTQPNQPDVLSVLAMDAFIRHDYQQAIEYWERILKSVSSDSEEGQALRRAIAQAQKSINSSRTSAKRSSLR